MLKLIGVLLIAAVAYIAYQKLGGASLIATTSGYSLSDVEFRPIPKKEFFALWTDVARQGCKDAREKNNLSPDECRDMVKERASGCYATIGSGAPHVVESRRLTRELGRAYLDCIQPHFFCNGVEVKTELDAQFHCKR